MKTITTTAIVALMTATIGLSAIAPTYAQQAAPAPSQEQAQAKAPGANFRPNGPRQGGGFGDLLGFERGSEAVEIALVRLSHAIELTTEQQALFDTLKTDALKAADTFSTAIEGLRPAAPAEGQTAQAPDFATRLDTRIAVEKAHLAALEAIKPSASAFFSSLTTEQTAALTPQRPDRNGGPGMFGKSGQHQGQQSGHQHKGPGPMGAPGAAPAPQAPAANG